MKWRVHSKTGKNYLDIRWKAELGVNRRAKLKKKIEGILKTEVELPEVLTDQYKINFQFNVGDKRYLFLNADDDRPTGGLYRLVELS